MVAHSFFFFIVVGSDILVEPLSLRIIITKEVLVGAFPPLKLLLIHQRLSVFWRQLLVCIVAGFGIWPSISGCVIIKMASQSHIWCIIPITVNSWRHAELMVDRVLWCFIFQWNLCGDLRHWFIWLCSLSHAKALALRCLHLWEREWLILTKADWHKCLQE